MLRVNSFLGCFKLETGGLVIGWISLIQNILASILCLITIILMSVYSCEDLKQLLEKEGRIDDSSNNFDESCKAFKGVIFVVIIIGLVISIGVAWISYLCIKGTENRNHARVKPMMILLAITAILCFLGILSFTASAIITGLFYGAIYGYLFVVIYSLHETFIEERERGVATQYHQPGSKV